MLTGILNNLYKYDDLPEWYKDNEYVVDNYRPWDRSYKYYLKSIFKIHNETANIWTHLTGCIFYILFIYIYNFIYFDYLSDIYNTTNAIITNIYLVTAFICFLFSTIMHTIHPKSNRICNNSCTIDYIGITILISGSYSPFIYYLFYCDKTLEKIYIIVINSLAIINIAICFLSFMYNSKYFRYKALVYIIYILFILVPLFNKYIKDGFTFKKEILYDIKYYFLSLLVYIIAISFYLTRFPEKYFKIKYFNSHSYFHIFSFIGSVCILISIFEIQFLYNNINCNNISYIKYSLISSKKDLI